MKNIYLNYRINYKKLKIKKNNNYKKFKCLNFKVNLNSLLILIKENKLLWKKK